MLENKIAHASLCVPKYAPTYISRLQKQPLILTEKLFRLSESNLYALKKITCTV